MIIVVHAVKGLIGAMNMIKAKNWNDLVGLVSKDGKYELVIDEELGYGRIEPVDKNFKESKGLSCYLSTHSFYEGFYKGTNKVLKEYGFDVEVESWG